ncbi:DedA family protein [Rufibacter immobilis]|uniref:DedA family protein n=1 Tax=Rufibacter immobilis TaxID=1348778 RepID=A0A3M9N7G8_9BACT|nr:DedA family protein [Rufibacter immobilis]RNI33153.1 DedA family protein [Rufibacter immobilis]
MELLRQFIDLFLHLDQHLSQIITDYGTWTYIILFLIIFVETGVVVMPFLPGDSLLFAAGAFAAKGDLNVWLLLVLLFVAAFLGDTLNYMIGNHFGPKVFRRDYRFLKREYLIKTQAFYEKHGGKTIIFARFIPIIRTFAPFVAGVGTMKYSKFLSYNVIGGLLWVVGFVVAGFVFGNIPAVKKNFSLVIFGIILLSVIPPIIEMVKHKLSARKQ